MCDSPLAKNLECAMAVIKITDLSTNLDLDRKAMSAIQGGGRGDWVFSVARPYFEAPAQPADSFGPGGSPINLYQITNEVTNNNYFIENKVINLANSGSNSTVNAVMISSC
jgi:hypothetical protein